MRKDIRQRIIRLENDVIKEMKEFDNLGFIAINNNDNHKQRNTKTTGNRAPMNQPNERIITGHRKRHKG